MGCRVAQRLDELRRQRDRGASTGTSVVVLKSALVVPAARKLGFSGETRSADISFHNRDARDAGRAAGDQVSFNRGVGRADGTLLLSNRS
jgi:hypothetical protein